MCKYQAVFLRFASCEHFLDMAQTSAEGLIDKIDRGLAAYYRDLKRSDYHNGGVGKFSQYCDENGMKPH